MKVIGYGICGPGEAKRYMRETLEEFKRLCDEVIICVNIPDGFTYEDLALELDMINEFGFKTFVDGREWGKLQWKIKQDFLETEVSKLASEGDMLVCLDMDEVLDTHLTKQWLLEAEMDAYHVFVVDLWNNREYFKLESCFWNVRIWRWNGNTKFVEKPVHCGLAPEWAYHYHRHAPFILKHYGLMERSDRQRKIARYEKYDPDAKHLDRRYYKMLNDDTAEPFDEESLHDTIAKEVATYKQTKPRGPQRFMTQAKGRFAYVRNPAGNTMDIPEKHLAQTLKRAGFTFLGYAEDAQEEIHKMFEEGEAELPTAPAGNYQRPMADEKAEVKQLESQDDRMAALYASPVLDIAQAIDAGATSAAAEQITEPVVVPTPRPRRKTS